MYVGIAQETTPNSAHPSTEASSAGSPLLTLEPLAEAIQDICASPAPLPRHISQREHKHNLSPAVDGDVATVSYCILPGPAAQGDMLRCSLCKLSRSPTSAAAGQFTRAYCRHVGRWGHLLHFADCANDCDGACRRAPQGFFQRKRFRRG